MTTSKAFNLLQQTTQVMHTEKKKVLKDSLGE